jgi:hypothetical protein
LFWRRSTDKQITANNHGRNAKLERKLTAALKTSAHKTRLAGLATGAERKASEENHKFDSVWACEYKGKGPADVMIGFLGISTGEPDGR